MWPKLIFLCLLSCATLQAKDIYRDYLIKWEGYSHVVYLCPAGKRTIGIGHNLDASGRLAKTYTTKQIEVFYTADLSLALQAARNGVVGFDSLPNDVKRVIISLAFTVGGGGFSKFVKFREALSNRDYAKAAAELQNSRWWSQVAKSRAEDHYSTLLKQAPTSGN